MRALITTFLVIFGTSAYGVDMVRSATPDSRNKIGVGVVFSGTTGLSLYADMNRSNFLQASIGYERQGSYAVTTDYAFGYRQAFASLPTLTPYWGLGAVLLHDQSDYWSRYTNEEDQSTETYVGARLPLGMNFVIPQTPVQLTAELAPSLLMTPVNYGYLQGGLSARVLF